MTQALRPDMISDEFARTGNDRLVGKTYPALGLAVIVAVDVAAVWLLRLIF